MANLINRPLMSPRSAAGLTQGPNIGHLQQQFWQKIMAPQNHNYFPTLFSFALQHRDALKDQVFLKNKLQEHFMRAENPKDYDYLRSLAAVDLVFHPNSGFSRMVEAVCYLHADNGVSAYATLSTMPKPLDQIQEEIGFHYENSRIKYELTLLREFFKNAENLIEHNPDNLCCLKS